MTQLTDEEKVLLDSLAKPKYNFDDIEKYFIAKGLNPFAPWKTEDHKRVQDILEGKNK